jgi:hypothetical protein
MSDPVPMLAHVHRWCLVITIHIGVSGAERRDNHD